MFCPNCKSDMKVKTGEDNTTIYYTCLNCAMDDEMDKPGIFNG